MVGPPNRGIVKREYSPLQGGARVILLTGLVATAAFVLLSPLDLESSVMEQRELYVAIRFVAQSLLMFVSFGVFFINWLPPGGTKDLQSVFIALAFFSTGTLTFAHIMTCRELLNVLEDPEDPMGSYFHLLSGATIACGLAIASFIPRTRIARKSDVRLLFAGFLAYTGIMLAFPLLLPSSIPELCPHRAPGGAFRIGIEGALALALVIATVKFYDLSRKTKDMSLAYLSSATLLGVFSHAAFILHENPYDIHSAMSVCYSIAAYTLVFVALFRGGVIQPYQRLTMTQNQADRRRREAEAATVKAQTYLDFLSHDIANMISPVMNRTEMILQSPSISDKERHEAQKIVEQMQKVSSLIQNLRRLSSAEKIDARTLGPVDLRSLFTDLERTRMERYSDIDLRVTVRFPDDPEVKVVGGSVAEEIIEEIFDNAIKHANKNIVKVEVDVHHSKGDSPDGEWIIEIRDYGPGITDQTKMALDITSSDPKRRFMRGIASSLSVIPLIVEQLGGRIRIEDRVHGDYSQGTKVVITLPRAT